MPGPAIRKKTDLRKQKAVFEGEFHPERELVFVMQEWTDGYNVGGLFRVAAACGARELIGIGRTPLPPHPMIGVTSLGMHRRVPFRHFPKWDDAVTHLREASYQLVAVEIAEGAESFRTASYASRVALVLGSETGGITAGLLRQCDQAVYIPMVGKGRSLNVHVAAAIVGYEVMLRGSDTLVSTNETSNIIKGQASELSE